jgi:hypothetical protein
MADMHTRTASDAPSVAASNGEEVIVEEVVVDEVIFEEPTSKPPERATKAPATRAKRGLPGTSSKDEEPATARPTCSFTFCPICMAMSAIEEAKPELVEHLMVAGREALLAVRSIIDARLEGSAPSESPKPAKLERLRID